MQQSMELRGFIPGIIFKYDMQCEVSLILAIKMLSFGIHSNIIICRIVTLFWFVNIFLIKHLFCSCIVTPVTGGGKGYGHGQFLRNVHPTR